MARYSHRAINASSGTGESFFDSIKVTNPVDTMVTLLTAAIVSPSQFHKLPFIRLMLPPIWRGSSARGYYPKFRRKPPVRSRELSIPIPRASLGSRMKLRLHGLSGTSQILNSKTSSSTPPTLAYFDVSKCSIDQLLLLWIQFTMICQMVTWRGLSHSLIWSQCKAATIWPALS